MAWHVEVDGAMLIAVDGLGAAWIAVLAALLSALISTGGAVWLQRKKADIDEAAAEVAHARDVTSQIEASIKAASEKLMISAIRSHHFAQGLRDLMAQHSGASVGKLSRDWMVFQIDQHDRSWRVLQPAMEAQAALPLAASPAVYEPAHVLLEACLEAVGVATTKGSGRGQVSSSIAGLKWTPEEEQTFAERLANITSARSAFAEAAREYLDPDQGDGANFSRPTREASR